MNMQVKAKLKFVKVTIICCKHKVSSCNFWLTHSKLYVHKTTLYIQFYVL